MNIEIITNIHPCHKETKKAEVPTFAYSEFPKFNNSGILRDGVPATVPL